MYNILLCEIQSKRMLVEDYIIKENTGTILYQTESIRKLNEQLLNNVSKKIETLEKELLSLTDLLIADGNLLSGNN
jgi:hypothetical protein